MGSEMCIRDRREAPIRTVGQMVEVCRQCVPRSRNHDIHPATRTFQALRIAVNDELGALERTLASAPQWFRPGGRLAIISFHSLEDRMVKQAFRDDDRWSPLTRKPLRPTDHEIHTNPIKIKFGSEFCKSNLCECPPAPKVPSTKTRG